MPAIAIYGTTSSDDVLVSGNLMRGGAFGISTGILVEGAVTNLVIHGNILGSIFATDFVSSVHGMDITDNLVGGEITVVSSIPVVIAGNRVTNSTTWGIYLEGENCVIRDNMIVEPGTSADDSYSGISLLGDFNLITGNRVIPASGANATRSAVSIVSGDCNRVVGNDFGDDPADYGTAPVEDGGTNTMLFFPNNPTAGDNFVDCVIHGGDGGGSPGGGVACEDCDLGDLGDVDTAGAAPGDALVYDGTDWGPMPLGSFGGGGGAPTDVQYDYIATGEATTSATFTDLTTPGPDVTVAVGSSGLLFVQMGLGFGQPASGQGLAMSVQLSGANSYAVADVELERGRIWTGGTNTTQIGASVLLVFPGLTPGNTTVTVKYKSGNAGSSAFFQFRSLTAWTF